jgi:hypothetical protein
MEDLVSPNAVSRNQALESLLNISELPHQPLLVYLLATRILDPDIQIRTRAVKIVHDLLEGCGSWERIDNLSLEYLAEFLMGFGKDGLIKLLEISADYLAAEEAVGSILKLSSYAGKTLSGIVSDRKVALQVRQQAVFFSGEIGFLSTIPAIKNLVNRIEKERDRTKRKSGRDLEQDLETLYLQAVAALSKLEG